MGDQITTTRRWVGDWEKNKDNYCLTKLGRKVMNTLDFVRRIYGGDNPETFIL